MKRVIFLKPHLESKIWGSNHLTNFNIDLHGKNNIGEAWVVSGYEGKSNIIINGKYKNITLFELYNSNRNLFANHSSPIYPLLVKLLDCNDDLSVQVHPDDQYAKQYNSLGKTECWYILQAKQNANLILGHNAKNKDELKKFIDNNQWESLLKKLPVKKDDFLYIPAKTIHGINNGIVLYELQQSSDLTFRLYDYNRLENGRPRQLHLKQSIESTQVPYVPVSDLIVNKHGQYLVDNNFFCLMKIVNKGIHRYHIKSAKWLQITVIDGSCYLDGLKKINMGMSFIILNKPTFCLFGKATILVSYLKN